jgi:hypothetical protein
VCDFHAARPRGPGQRTLRRGRAALRGCAGRAARATGGPIGLGIARYKLGELDEAHRALTEVAAGAPEAPAPQLYLALIAIRRSDDAAAEDHLARYLGLGAPPRLAVQLERTRQALRGGPVTPPLRDFMAASLEDAYQWAGEVTAALAALRNAELRYVAADRIYLLPRACRCR